jgi:hypothetical protein
MARKSKPAVRMTRFAWQAQKPPKAARIADARVLLKRSAEQHVTEELSDWRKSAQAMIKDFSERFVQDPQSALEWSVSVFEAAAEEWVLEAVLSFLSKDGASVATVLEWLIDERDCLNRYSQFRSTYVSVNLAKESKRVALNKAYYVVAQIAQRHAEAIGFLYAVAEEAA